jgi:hypothetical protein
MKMKTMILIQMKLLLAEVLIISHLIKIESLFNKIHTQISIWEIEFTQIE